MTLKEYQELQRLRKIIEFGEIGVKDDCKHCGNNGCVILKERYCKKQVCQFYDKR